MLNFSQIQVMKTRIYIVLISCIVALYSCDNGLEKFPLDSPSDSNFLSTQAEMEMAIQGAYATLKTTQGYSYPSAILMECLSDNGWERAEQSWITAGNGQHDSNNSLMSSFWSQYYLGIGRCNFMIENMVRGKENTSEDIYNRILAEAKFIRAFHYFWLTELFGDVPFPTKPITRIEETQMAKTDKAEIVDYLLKELNEAASILPVEISDKELGRASKGAALALRAKIALHNQQWDEAIQSSLEVMKLGYALAENYESLFKNGEQQKTKEVIFSLQYLYQYSTYGPNGITTRMAKGYSSKIPTQALIDSYECIDGLSIDKSPLYNPQKPFENRDPRLGYTCVVPGSIFRGYQFESHKDSIECWNYNTNPATRVANQDALNAYATFSGYCWRKYAEWSQNDPTVGETPIILLRYADVLLMYAEAKIEANKIDASVYDAINLVRQRVGMPVIDGGKTQEQLRSVIRKERRYELAFEGSRRFDIIRWKIAEQVMSGNLYGRIPKGLLSSAPKIDEWGTPSYDNVANKSEMRVIEMRKFNKDRDYLFPIPRLEIETNN